MHAPVLGHSTEPAGQTHCPVVGSQTSLQHSVFSRQFWPPSLHRPGGTRSSRARLPRGAVDSLSHAMPNDARSAAPRMPPARRRASRRDVLLASAFASKSRWLSIFPPWPGVFGDARPQSRLLLRRAGGEPPPASPYYVDSVSSLLLTWDHRARAEGQDRLRSLRHFGGDDAAFVDEVADGRGEHPVRARDLPPTLQQDWEGQSVLHHLPTVLLFVASAHHKHPDVGDAAVKLLEPGGELVARAAMGVREDEQDAPPAVLRERQRPAVDTRQGELGRAGAGRKPRAEDATLTEGTSTLERLALCVPSSVAGRGRRSSQREQRLRARGDRARDSALRVDQVAHRRTGGVIELADSVLLLEKHGTADVILLEQPSVVLRAASGHNDGQRVGEGQGCEVRCHLRAIAALGVEEHEQHSATAVVRETTLLAREIPQLEVRRFRSES